LLEPAEMSRPRFKYGRDATMADTWTMLTQCSALLDTIYTHHDDEYTRRSHEPVYSRPRHNRVQHHEQYLGFAPGEIVTLTAFGAEYQERKLGSRQAGRSENEWVEGGRYYGAALQYTLLTESNFASGQAPPDLTPECVNGVVVCSDGEHYCVATNLTAAK